MTIDYINNKKPKDSLFTALCFNGEMRHQLKMIDVECKCGKIKSIAASYVLRGKTKSCGCTRKINSGAKPQFTGDSKRVRAIWQCMKCRCYNTTTKSYFRYGGRGILICDEWLNNFKSFLDWSLLNGYKEKLTIDRIDNDLGYEPNNCRWVTVKKNCNNKRNCIYITHNGVIKTLQEWSEQLGINRDRLKAKLFDKGCTIADFLK